MQLQTTYKTKLAKIQTPQEYTELNTIAIEQKEPNSPIKLSLKKITTIKEAKKQSLPKMSTQAKKALDLKAKLAKKQSLERVKQWVESRTKDLNNHQ